MPACDHPSDLERWLRSELAPYHPSAPTDVLLPAPLVDLRADVPILDEPQGASCVWAGRLGSIATWQAHDQGGALVARVATAPKQGLSVPDAIVTSHPYAYHQSAIGSGPHFKPYAYHRPAIRSGPHFNGYILGDDLVGIINIERGQRLLFLVAQFAGAGVEDRSGYWQGEAILARLSFR
jgi:hypothetical protein